MLIRQGVVYLIAYPLITTRASILIRLTLIPLLLAGVLTVSSCGQSGDLYLPEATASVVSE